jgi:RNA polymerase sigma-70 factor (ECF subfamily)
MTLACAPHGPATATAQRRPRAEDSRREDLDPWTLVRAYQSGDSDAFATLYTQHVDAVYRYLRIQLKDPALAEDLTSETFLRALRGLDRVHRRDSQFSAWLFAIATNLLRDHHRWVTRHPRDERTPPDVPDTVAGPEDLALAAADPARAALSRCLPQLSADQRSCLYLRFIAGLSVSETAASMQRTCQGIRALQYRSIRRLAELMPDAMAAGAARLD